MPTGQIISARIEPRVKARFLERAGELEVSPARLLERVIISYIGSPTVEPVREKKIIEKIELDANADFIEIIDGETDEATRFTKKEFTEMLGRAVRDALGAEPKAKVAKLKIEKDEDEEELELTDDDLKALVGDKKEEEYKCGECGHMADFQFTKCPKCHRKAKWD